MARLLGMPEAARLIASEAAGPIDGGDLVEIQIKKQVFKVGHVTQRPVFPHLRNYAVLSYMVASFTLTGHTTGIERREKGCDLKSTSA